MHGQLETEAGYTLMAADAPPGMESPGMHGFAVRRRDRHDADAEADLGR